MTQINMGKLQPLFRRRTSWLLLTSLFVFDNIVSYFAIARWGGHEGNLIIAPLVEKYPLLYFLAIPVTLAIMLAIVRVILVVSMYILRTWKVNRGVIERIVLTSVVIYWAVGNSSMNLFFLIGHRQKLYVWGLTSLMGVLLGFVYGLIALMATQRHGDTVKCDIVSRCILEA